MPYYVTKYALTEGILKVEEADAEVADGYLYVGESRSLRMQVAKKDWFTGLEEAEQRVARLVEKKLRSIEKATKKLHSYKAPIVEWSNRKS